MILRTAVTASMPREAISPISAGMSRLPAGIATSPAARSSPAWRTFCPGLDSASIATVFESELTSSWATTVSVPSGIGAPVMILAACPARTDSCNGFPAHAVPTSESSLTPVPGMSTAANAKPSRAELVCPGTLIGDTRSDASTRPRHCPTVTDSVSVMASTAAAIRRRASSIGSNPSAGNPRLVVLLNVRTPPW